MQGQKSLRHLPIPYFGYVNEWNMREAGPEKDYQSEGHMDLKMTLAKQN